MTRPVRVIRFVVVSLAGAAAFVAVAPNGAGGAGDPQHETVKVHHNYYSPAQLTVNNRSTVTWEWPEDAGETHDVVLHRGPSGAKRFASDRAAAAFTYRRTLTRPGTYSLVCTHHDGMTMTIEVRR